MAATIAAFSGGLKMKAGVLAVQISSLPLRREFPRFFSSSSKTVAAISSSLRVSAVYHQRSQSSWSRLATFCTAAPDAGTTVSADESEKKSESLKEEESVKETANLLDIKVGRIVKAWQHEEADSLYVEEVDVGEAEPRIICSGLVKYVPLDLLQGTSVVVLANLKPRNMRGVKSCGMLLAASDSAHENVELLVPPEGSVPGDRVWFGNEDDLEQLPEPAPPNKVQKKKMWESVQPLLKTDASGVSMLKDEHLMRTSSGLVTSKSLRNANIS
ncbi:PREDICTED: aminoacyl tRNA synthase complex-interacting multifunctional protein 1-like [Camelina sativa]|uniref:Aminoacyl tRNA synthase complex-interacting multifunctional protein 1-like n=1 Tax=Camelina sativa TaxID=90675 RepID=A0ABM0WCV0_CAMSA|nr:PREDICTED: aminoacyl tRNA synthase complex-interacting multifunctional protein 1-like [Camelina sativa]